MAPLARTPSSRTTKPRRRRRKPRRAHCKNQSKVQETSTGFSSSSFSSKTGAMEDSDQVVDEVSTCSSSCSTPKGQKFQIPEISTCPPAPKKRRVLSNCSLRRSPISFFAPPDLELFFFAALRDISV